MAFESSLIKEEVDKVIADGVKPVHVKWTCEILANGKTITPFALLSIDILRDYYENYADTYQIEMLIGPGTYQSDVISAKDTLMVTLYKYQLKGGSNEKDINAPIFVQTYKASILEAPTSTVQTASPDNIKSSAADLSNPIKVQLQLVETVVDYMRDMTCGEIYDSEVTINALRVILGNESYKAGGSPSIRGVDIIPPSNSKPRSNIIIPQGTPLVSLPIFFQNLQGGIYSTGMGYYMQGGLWYIYPIADMTRYNKPHLSLTVVNVPISKLNNIDRTYRITDKHVIVLATGKMQHNDDSEEKQKNLGNGARFTDSEKIREGLGTYIGNNRYMISRKKNNTEFFSMARKDGFQKSMIGTKRHTKNPFVNYSEIAIRECTYITFEWQHSNETLIYPGMPARFYYDDNDQVNFIDGVVFNCHHFITGNTNSMVDVKHVTTSSVTLIVKKV
jgi:hypothetical protein